MFKGVSQCVPTDSLLYFGQFNPFHLLSLLLHLPSPTFQQLSVHRVSSTFTSYVLHITDALSFPFPFLLSPSSTEKFHCHKHVLHLSLCMTMLVFEYTLSFASIFYVWEKKCDFCVSEPGLCHLTWCPPIASMSLQAACGDFWVNTDSLGVQV
jgi:hypothetical protein